MTFTQNRRMSDQYIVQSRGSAISVQRLSLPLDPLAQLSPQACLRHEIHAHPQPIHKRQF